MSEEVRLREEIVEVGRSLFARGYTHGSTGNISARLEDGWLLTPTGTSLGTLDPGQLSKIDEQGRLVSGQPPTKEDFLHRSVYQARQDASAVVHLHSTHAVAFSCLPVPNTDDALPKLTAYSHMQCGCVRMVGYYRPGDRRLADAVGDAARKHWSILLAHHGPVVAGKSLRTAMHAAEELEETARIALALRGANPNHLTPAEVRELDANFPPW